MRIPLLGIHILSEHGLQEHRWRAYTIGKTDGRSEEGRIGNSLIAKLLHENSEYRKRYGELPS
jgi:hypothetical protein